jgi:hypothetical protein
MEDGCEVQSRTELFGHVETIDVIEKNHFTVSAELVKRER